MKKSKKLQKLKNNCVYYLAVVLFSVINIIPRSLAQCIGGFFGKVAYHILKYDREIAVKNLKIAYGDNLNNAERNKIIKGFYINSGKNIIDVFRFNKYYKKQLDGLIDVEGLEHFKNAYRKGKGIIAITGHIGNFELLAAWFVNNGYNAAVIGREMYDKRLDRMLVGNRETMGILNIDTTDSPRKIMKVLKEGYALGVLIDIDSHRIKSEYVTKFGKMARTPVGQTILGLKAGSSFIPMACVREGKKYKILVKPEIEYDKDADFENKVIEITQKCNLVLEEIIKRYPDQWTWIHDRWKSTPKEDKPINTRNK
jgi:KDO2-lipid IV(A) lauroyltransferase